MPWIVLDFETASACDLKVCGADRYAEDPTTEVLCLSWCVGNGPVQTWFPGDPIPADIEKGIAENWLFIAHSARFERGAWREIMVKQFGWPPIPLKLWHDTQAKMAMLVMPLDLETGAKTLGLPVEKDMEGRRITLGLSKPDKKTGMYPARTPAVMARVGEYCEGDIHVQRALHKRIGWLPEGERRVWLLDQKINDRGVRLDMPLVQSMQRIVDEASVPLAAEFSELTGGLRMTQRDKVLSWMLDRGVWLPNMTKDTLAAVLGETEDGEEVDDDDRIKLDLPPDVHRALHIRQLIGSSSVKKLGTMAACVCADGRAHGLLQYHGAGPGRWAGRLIQPQNFPRGTLKVDGEAPDIDPLVDALMTGDHEYVEAIYGPAVEACVSSLRYTIIANPGRRLLAGDYAGIEARLSLAVAGQHDKTALMAAGADVYVDMASQIYKRPIDKKRDPAERQVGKNSVLGLGFQMGAPKFHSRYCSEQSMEFAQTVVNTYRQEWAPEVPKLWRGLENAAVRTVHERRPHEAYGVLYALEDEWLTARLPSGRKLWYFNPRPIRKAMPWDETDVRLAWTYQAKKSGRWVTIDAFGGLLTENVAQGLARDLLVHAMFKAETNGFPICFTVHDEIVAEPLVKDADEKAFKQIMEDVPDWARTIQLPVAVETWENDRYRK